MSDRFLKDLNKSEEPEPTDESEKTHHCAHLARSPARNPVGQPRTASRSPLPEKLRAAAQAAQADSKTRGLKEDLKQKILYLEDTVAEYERQKYSVMGTFQEYRERVAERERKLEAEYSAKIISLSEEVLAAKKDFEERMKQFQALQEKFEREKESALEKLRQEHQREIHILEQRCSDTQLLNLEQKYMIEIQRLDEERKCLRAEKERLGEAFESKLKRAQSLYETELSSAKALYTNELEALRDHEVALRMELVARQEEFRDRLEEMNLQFQQSKDELAKCKIEVAELEERLKQKEIEVEAISKQLQQVRFDTDDSMAKLKKAENDLEISQQKYSEQEEQLKRKSDMLEVLEQTKAKLEVLIQDLQSEIKSLRNKVTFLENERQNLESQSRTQAQLQDSQLQALHSVLENLTKEKQSVKDHYDQLLQEDRIAAEEKEFKLKKEYSAKLSELERQNKALEDHMESRIRDERTKIREELRSIYEVECDNLRASRKQVETELSDLRRSKSSDHACPECSSLKHQMINKDRSLTDAHSKLNEVSSLCDSLKKEVDKLRSETQQQKGILKNLSADQSDGTTQSSGMEKDLLDKLNAKEAEIAAMSEKLKALQTESNAIETNQDWSAKEKEYQEELAQLKTKLDGYIKRLSTPEAIEKAESHSEKDTVVEDLNSVIKGLKEELAEAKKSLSDTDNTDSSAKEALEAEIAKQKAELTQQLESNELKIKELQMAVAEKEALAEEKLKKQLESQAAMEKEFEGKLTRLQSSASTSHDDHLPAEIEDLQAKIKAMQTETEAKEADHMKGLEALQNQVREKDEMLTTMSAKVNSLASDLSQLSSELEQKGKDMAQLKKETHEYIATREKTQAKAHKREVDKLKAENEASKQRLTEVEQKLNGQLKKLQQKLADELETSDRAKLLSKAEPNEIVEQIEAEIVSLKKKLSDKQEEIGKLEAEKSSTPSVAIVETATETEEPQTSALPTPFASASPTKESSAPGQDISPPITPPVDSSVEVPHEHNHNRKRDSICSTTSTGGSSVAAGKSSLMHKWHCLVTQLNSNQNRSGQASTSRPPLPKGARLCSRSDSHDLSPPKDGRQVEPQQRPPAPPASEPETSRMEESHRGSNSGSEGRSSRADHNNFRGSTTSLKLPESRRVAGKSPSRSPAPKPGNLPVSKRPPWRM